MAKSAVPIQHRIAFSVQEAANLLGINKPTLYRFIHTGQLPSYRIGRRRLIRAESLDSFQKDLEDEHTHALSDCREA